MPIVVTPIGRSGRCARKRLDPYSGSLLEIEHTQDCCDSMQSWGGKDNPRAGCGGYRRIRYAYGRLISARLGRAMSGRRVRRPSYPTAR
jgi:hypothetical protein